MLLLVNLTIMGFNNVLRFGRDNLVHKKVYKLLLCCRMGCLVDVRPIDLLTLKNHVSSNWWHSGNQQEEEFERRKSIYLRDCKTINNKILGNIVRHKMLNTSVKVKCYI